MASPRRYQQPRIPALRAWWRRAFLMRPQAGYVYSGLVSSLMSGIPKRTKDSLPGNRCIIWCAFWTKEKKPPPS